METQKSKKLRKQLVSHLKGGKAFISIDSIIKKVHYKEIGIVPEGLPYSFYQQFYHIRFAQLDILDYCRDENYEAQNWPDDYWPKNPAPANEREWDDLIEKYFDERDEFCDLILDTSNDLFKPFEANPDHHLFREAQLVIEHTAYHTGQLYVIYRLLNA